MALATFVYFSLLAYFRHVPGWFPVVSLHEVHKLSPKMQGKNKKIGGIPFWGFIYDFVILNFKELRQI